MRETTNMRSGFTMIELIFVIVIIGILAAVAIPKLAATRDDAKLSQAIADAKTCINDAGAAYTAGSGALDSAWTKSSACVAAEANTLVTTTVNSNSVTVSGTGITTLDTEHGFGGTAVVY